MRVLGLLILLMLGLGFGGTPMPATAEPCPFHTHESATIDGEASRTGAAVAPITAGDGPIVVAVAAFGYLGSIAPHSAPDHPIPEGEFCCHAAVAVTAAIVPAVGPYHGTVSRAFLPLGLPPWAAPLSDIYRPPAAV